MALQTHGVSGCGYNKEQQLDGVQMGKFAAANDVDHVMLLGDNFYGSGIHSDDSSCRFKKTFEDVYNARRVPALKPPLVQTALQRSISFFFF